MLGYMVGSVVLHDGSVVTWWGVLSYMIGVLGYIMEVEIWWG